MYLARAQKAHADVQDRQSTEPVKTANAVRKCQAAQKPTKTGNRVQCGGSPAGGSHDKSKGTAQSQVPVHVLE